MNMLDMHTREKVNKMHIAEMHREADKRHLLRDMNAERITVIARERIGLVLLLAILLLIVGGFLLSAAANS